MGRAAWVVVLTVLAQGCVFSQEPAPAPQAGGDMSGAVDMAQVDMSAPADMAQVDMSAPADMAQDMSADMCQDTRPTLTLCGGAEVCGPKLITDSCDLEREVQCGGCADANELCVANACQITYLRPPSEPEESKGVEQFAAVAVSGEEVFVGMPNVTSAGAEQAGQVWIYGKNALGEWALKEVIAAPTGGDRDRGNAHFGATLLVEGDTLYVGAPDAMLLREGEKYDTAGLVHVFKRSAASGWLFEGTISPNSPRHNGRFGRALAYDRAEDKLFVGSPGDPGAIGFGEVRGLVEVFRIVDGATRWEYERTLEDQTVSDSDEFGRALLLWHDQVLVGAPGSDVGDQSNAGSVYIFPRQDSTSRVRLVADRAQSNERFGVSLAGSAEGIAVGGPGAARVHWYVPSNGEVDTAAQVLTHPDAVNNERFGMSLALRGDRLIIGAPAWELYRGRALLMRRDASSGKWSAGPSYTQGDQARVGDALGLAVGIGDGFGVIVAPGAVTGGTRTGGGRLVSID